MNDDATIETAAIRTTEGTPDPTMDLFLAHWPRIAATAWEGFRGAGRGVVTVVDGSIPLAVVDDDGDVTWIAKLGGWPTPPETDATVTATLLGATLQ
jgi:hypothetical protein